MKRKMRKWNRIRKEGEETVLSIRTCLDFSESKSVFHYRRVRCHFPLYFVWCIWWVDLWSCPNDCSPCKSNQFHSPICNAIHVDCVTGIVIKVIGDDVCNFQTVFSSLFVGHDKLWSWDINLTWISFPTPGHVRRRIRIDITGKLSID